MNTTNYPPIFLRVKAAVIDAVLIMMLMYTATVIFSRLEIINSIVKMVTFVFIFMLYEPLMVRFLGASLGHLFCDLKVGKDNENHTNLSLPVAIIRFLIKSTLGWLSLLSISGDSKKRAIHDILAKSVVIYLEKKNLNIFIF